MKIYWMDEFREYHIIFTKANADTDGRIINQRIEEYAKRNAERVIVVSSLGMLRYLSALQYCDMVIGNSSSGIVEAPSFRIPTVNIGDRQKGRTKGESIIDCGWGKEEVTAAIRKAQIMHQERTLVNVVNPYEGVKTTDQIMRSIKKYLYGNQGIKKKFYNLEWSE